MSVGHDQFLALSRHAGIAGPGSGHIVPYTMSARQVCFPEADKVRGRDMHEKEDVPFDYWYFFRPDI
jgi:hypothetical protein